MNPEIRWLAACGLLLGLGTGLLWAAGWLDPDGARLGRIADAIADAIEDALDVSDLFEDEIMPLA